MTQASVITKTPAIESPLTHFLAGIKDTFPLIVGAIPFGLIFGTLAQSSGVSFAGTMAMSAFVFAGSAQFISLGMLAAGANWPVIVLTTFVVNLRHALYSATLAPYVARLLQRWQIPLAFWLTDETFAVVVNCYSKSPSSPFTRWYHLGSSVVMYLNWQLCTFLGLTIGHWLPNATTWGLDFAMPVTFIGMVIPYLRSRPMAASVGVAGIVALIAYPLPYNLGLIMATLAGIGAGVLLETRARKSK